MKLPRQVYLIRHNKTNRVYVGSSYDANNRYKAHIWNLKNKAHPVEDMQKDFDDFGDDFSFEIIDTIFEFDDRKKEYDWMRKYNSFERGIGYNYKDKKFFPTKKENRDKQ